MGCITQSVEVGLIYMLSQVVFGIRRGCLLSPTLFNIFSEFVLKEIKCIPHRLSMNDKELAQIIKYADDTTLLALGFEKLQQMSSQLQSAYSKWGMKINTKKCKVSALLEEHISIDGEDIENVDDFLLLGSSVPNVKSDVDRRIALASTSFERLREVIWNNRKISLKLKMR